MSCLTEQGFCNDDRDASQACKTKKCFIVAWKIKHVFQRFHSGSNCDLFVKA